MIAAAVSADADERMTIWAFTLILAGVTLSVTSSASLNAVRMLSRKRSASKLAASPAKVKVACTVGL